MFFLPSPIHELYEKYEREGKLLDVDQEVMDEAIAKINAELEKARRESNLYLAKSRESAKHFHVGSSNEEII